MGEPDEHGRTLPSVEEVNIPSTFVQLQGFVNALRVLPKGGYDEQHPYADGYDFNSCAIDSIATLFKLLKLSEKPGYRLWKRKLTSSLVAGLFELVDQDWSLPDHELNKAKMSFYNEAIELYGEEATVKYQHYLQHLGVCNILGGLHGDLVNIVGFETDRRAMCSKCRFTSLPNVRYFSCIRLLNSNAGSDSIVHTVKDFFRFKRHSEEKNYCPKDHLCDVYVHIVKDLPEFLFVVLDGRKVEHDSTPRRQEIQFRTLDGPVTGTYGWLGSICYRKEDQHYKVFWASENAEELLAYDHHDGPNINCYRHGRNIEDAIPEDWWTQGELVILQRIGSRGSRAYPSVMQSSGVVDVDMEDSYGDGEGSESDDSYSPPE